jgi:hypothetical protein
MAGRSAASGGPGPQLSTGPLILGAALLGAGGILGAAGLAVGGVTLVAAARRWVGDREQPPAELVREHWHKTKAATAAGAAAWHNGAPAQR